MSLKVRCVLFRHKWTAAEGTTGPRLQMVCQRCGRMRTFRGMTAAERATEKAGEPPLISPNDPGNW
jgi:hypothetical protein